MKKKILILECYNKYFHANNDVFNVYDNRSLFYEPSSV